MERKQWISKNWESDLLLSQRQNFLWTKKDYRLVLCWLLNFDIGWSVLSFFCVFCFLFFVFFTISVFYVIPFTIFTLPIKQLVYPHKILHNNCLKFILGITVLWREIADYAYAKFFEYYGRIKTYLRRPYLKRW